MHYYQKNVKDWVVATAHLTPEEEGVYNRLMDYYYDTESPIPEDTTAVVRRLRLRGYEETVQAILEEFFVLEDGFWKHDRCDKEIELYCEKADRARKNGRKGGRPPKAQGEEKPKENPEETQSVSGENPEETQGEPREKLPLPNTQQPLPNNQKPNTHASFDEFWALYPKKVKRDKAKAKWSKLKPTGDLLNLITENIQARLACGDWKLSEKQYIPSAEAYLNGKRWEDEIIPKGGNPNAAHQQPRTKSLAERDWEATEQALADIEAREADFGPVGEDAATVRPQVGFSGRPGET